MKLFFRVEAQGLPRVYDRLYIDFQLLVHAQDSNVTISTSFCEGVELVVSDDLDEIRPRLARGIRCFQVLCTQQEEAATDLEREYPTLFEVFCLAKCAWPGFDCPDLPEMAKRIAQLSRELGSVPAPTRS